MALEIVRNISVDFYDKKYIMINAKQYDSSSRLISVTCYNQGEFFNLSSKKHSAYIKYRKADGHGVLNSCQINYKGDVLVELTEQMLAADGICYVDLIIVNKGSAIVNVDTGEIVTVDDTPILSTMAFCINVYESSVDNSEFESSYEYDGLNNLLKKAEADYTEVIMLSKSYAMGNANNIRENENFDNSKYYSRMSRSYAIGDSDNIRENENIDNSKYYSEQAHASAINADESEANANSYMNTTNEYMNTTNEYMNTAESHMNNANSYMNSANEYMDNANEYMDAAKSHMDAAAISELNARTSEDNAELYMNNADSYMDNAKISETNAKASESNAFNSANFAKSYTVGGTGTRENEDVDNARYYCELVKSVVNGLNSGFIPIGTITFSELATVEKATGFTYNISTDFTTDDSFMEGAGMKYTAGTNVYFTASGKWDCFGGSTPPTATVDEVKSYLGI